MTTKAFRVADVAALLGVAPSAVRALEQRGRIPKAKRDAHGRRQYDAASIKAILNTRPLEGEGLLEWRKSLGELNEWSD